MLVVSTAPLPHALMHPWSVHRRSAAARVLPSPPASPRVLHTSAPRAIVEPRVGDCGSEARDSTSRFTMGSRAAGPRVRRRTRSYRAVHVHRL
ncbi:unnamed protein product [Merluccius merluccius]